MALFKGIKRLNIGVSKTLTKSESIRGYIFITNDKSAKERLGNNFNIVIDGTVLINNNIDSSGRVCIGKSFTEKLSKKTFFIKMVGRQIEIYE